MRGNVYERQVDSVLTGGWNLLPPGDLIEKADALQCENFRINSAGNLRSRLGRGGAVWEPGDVRSFCQVKGVGVRRYAATYSGQLWRDGLRIDSGEFGDGPIAMVSYQGKLWAMARDAQRVDDGANLLDWSAIEPGYVQNQVAGGDLVIGQRYTYWATYALADGGESRSTNGSFFLDPAGSNRAYTFQQTGPPPADPRVIGWNLYRIGNTLQQALRLNTSPIGLGDIFTDTGAAADFLADSQVAQLGLELDPNSTAQPPPCNGLAGPYYDHLLGWGHYDHPNRLFWTGTLQPNIWPGAREDEGNHVDVGELGDKLVGVTIRPRVATIYKDSSIWRLVGDPDDLEGDLELVTPEIGATSPHIISVGGTDYFQGPEGVYAYNGERPVKVTGKLDPLFRGEFPENYGFAFSSGIRLNPDPAARQRNCLAHHRGRLYFFYCGGSAASRPNRGITCELGADNWASDSRPVRAILSEGSAAVDEATGEETSAGLLLASVDGGVVALEEGAIDDGTPIPLAYHSGYKDQGAPDNLKTYADVVIEHNTAGAQLTVAAFYNNGTGPIPLKLLASQEALGTIQSTSKTVTVFQCAQLTDKLGIQARNIAIRIEGESTSDVRIYKILVHYFIEPRNAKTYESDETDLGTERVKAVNEVEVDIDFPAAVGVGLRWQLYAQKPGSGWAVADFGTIATTNGRELVRIPIPGRPAGTVEGRLFRFTLRADVGEFRLYGLRMRMLPYGEYVDAASGETFETVALNVGI